MSRRDTAEIRREIAAERQRLDDNLTALEGELLSGVPLLVGGFAAAVVAAVLAKRRRKRKKRTGITITWKVR